MARTPKMFTKRSKILGLPIGRRRTDWRKVGVTGLGVASSVAGTVGAKKAGTSLVHRVTDVVGKPLQQGKAALDGAKSVGDEASGIGRAMSAAKTPFGKIAAGLKSVGGGGDDGGGGGKSGNLTKLRLIIKESVDVAVPRRVAYNQWTQFEDLASILKGVANVSQEDDDVLNWSVKIGPSRRQWRAKIKEQNPDERIVWESADGTENRGVITFHSLDHNLTRVQVEMEYFPHGPIEKIGNIFLAARRRVRKDLRLFKHYMELSGEETGAWRGEISKGDQESEDQEPRDDAGSEEDEQETENEQAESPNGEAAGGGEGDDDMRVEESSQHADANA